MLNVFIGYDHRQPVSYNVLQQSIFRNSSRPVSITALKLDQLPITRGYPKEGLTPFTFSRFLVPYLCEYKGWGLFLDIDILVKGDIAELFNMADDKYAMMVSKNNLKFEWASVMLFNCEHPTNRCLTPTFVQTADRLHHIAWCKDDEIGDLPREWNHLVGYDEKRNDAKLIHYTQGVPCFPETQTSEYSADWHKEHKMTNSAFPWIELMGNSVHAGVKDGKVVPKFVAEGR